MFEIINLPIFHFMRSKQDVTSNSFVHGANKVKRFTKNFDLILFWNGKS